jgi:translation elongation factor aEF-1 beta
MLGSYVVRIKLYPESSDKKKEELVSSVTSCLPDGFYVKNATSEPIAFGLEAVIVDVVAPEEEGSIEKVESSISRAKYVSQYELLGVSRMSSKLPGS